MQKITKYQKKNRLKLPKKMDMYTMVIDQKANVIKISSLLKLIYRVNTTSVKISADIFGGK